MPIICSAGMVVHVEHLHPLMPALASDAGKCPVDFFLKSRTCRDMLMDELPPLPKMLTFPQVTFAPRSHRMAVYKFARFGG